jgi:hypothetical protein
MKATKKSNHLLLYRLFNLMTNRQYIRHYVQQKKKYENRYTPVIYKALRKEKAKVIQVAKEQGVLSALTQVNMITGEHIEAALKSLYKGIMPREAELAYRELNKTKDAKGVMGFSIDWLSDIVDFLDQNILNKVVRQLTATTMERVYRVIVNGNANGESYDEMVRQLMDTELDRNRARLIARTETNRAVNAGHDLGRKAYPYYVDKTWLAARDRRTRGADGEDHADHFHMNGLIVKEDEAFTDPRSGRLLMFPGDSSMGAQAADVCNCRCNVRFIPLRDKNGRLIMKPDRVKLQF